MPAASETRTDETLSLSDQDTARATNVASETELDSGQPARVRKAAALPQCFSVECPFESNVPPEVAQAIRQLEQVLEKPLVFLHQPGTDHRASELSAWVTKRLRSCIRSLPSNQRVALVLESPGGDAKSAFEIAMVLRRHCGGFDAVIPRYAKSAATLLSLGGDRIMMGRFAELGPLDMQITDPDAERWMSALDEVQSLSRLHSEALTLMDKTMFLLLQRLRGKSPSKLLPVALDFAARMAEPLLRGIDVVHFTQMARCLKIAEEYAIRLLQPRYEKKKAESIVRHLVEAYPDHGFLIDADEASQFGLEVERIPADAVELLDQILIALEGKPAIGSLIPTLGADHASS